MEDYPLRCENCGVHYTLSPGDSLDGAITNGLACPECGGKRFYREQPNPTHGEMDGGMGTLRDTPEPGQPDPGGNPLGEGTIMGDDHERPWGKRDNFMHGRVAVNDEDYPGQEDPRKIRGWPDPWPPAEHSCPNCGSEGSIEPGPSMRDPFWYCGNCGEAFSAPAVPHNAEPFKHPDPWMDNESGATVYPESWNQKSAALGDLTIPKHWGSNSMKMGHERTLDMEPYKMDGLFDLPYGYRQASRMRKEAGPLLLAVPEALGAGAEALGIGGAAEAAGAGGAAAAEGGAEAAGAAATEEAAGQSAAQWAKNKALQAVKNQAINHIKQRLLPAGGAAALMHGALGGGAGGGVQGADPATGLSGGIPGGIPQSEETGWQTLTPAMGVQSSVDFPMLLVADLETSDSVKSLDRGTNDPESHDQKEFNDRDKNPSNHENPNNEDSGASGEDGVREKTDGYGFGPNSPGLDRLMMLLPLALHYYQSEESGESDPLIRGLHDMLESESPGYLKGAGGDGHNMVKQIIQLHKPNPQTHAAGMQLQTPGGMAPQEWTNPAPQAMQNTLQPAAGRCPNCGGVTNPGQPCPQCGAQGQQIQANTVGPQTPEQRAVVEDYLLQHGRAEEVPNVELHPEQYAKELAEITQQPNVPPLPDPSQITPLQPVPGAGGAMPAPDPSQPGGGGAPLQPMSRKQADMGFRCPECGSGSTTPRQSAGDDGLTMECNACHAITPVGDNVDQKKYKGASITPRCPECGSGSTELRDSIGDDGPTMECSSCHAITPMGDNIDRKKYKGASFQIKGLVDIPNPALQQQEDSVNIMAWKDTEGNDLMPDRTYIVSSAAFPVPDVVKVLKVHPEHLDVKIATGQAAQLNPDENTPDFQIKRKEAQLDDYQFTPMQNQTDADDQNTELPPGGTPGLEQIPQSGQTTDEMANSFPHTTTSALVTNDEELEEGDTHCRKCGSTTVDSTMRDEVTTLHECVPCGHAWETQEEDFGREASVDLSWIMNGGEEDFHTDMERARAMAMADRGSQSRNLSSIVSKDPVYQAIHDRLNQAAMQREAGRKFTPGEKQELIRERGRARNLEDLNLENTHYDIRDDYTGKANSLNVRDDDLFLGL